jgi:hypothetical protein
MAKLGFAFSFGARDDGMGRAMGSALDSITKINKGLATQNGLAAGNKLAGALKAVAGGAGKAAMGVGGMAKGLAGAFSRGVQNRVNSFNLASMAQNIRGLTEDSGDLSTSMESIGASYAQQARPALAMMGATGAELKKLTGQASGMAYGMNVGVETVVKTMGALRNAGAASKSVFDALGMSTQEFVKLAEGTGMATEQLGALGGDLVASWGFTGKQAKQTLEYMVAMGNQGGIGAQMFTQMGDQMGGLNTILAKQVATHMRSAAEIQSTVQASVRLAGAYHQMGLSGEEASKAASETSNKFLEWQVAVERAQLGLGEMPEIFTKLSALGMGTEEAMRMIALGSQDSAAGMAEMGKWMKVAQASGKQLDAAVLGDLTETFGEAGSNAVYLAMSTTQGATALEKMSTATVKADGALKKFANDSYSSGRTLQEGLDMARESFRMQMRSITRPEVIKFVNEEKAALRELGKEAKLMGSDATWGPMLKTFSVFDQMGAKGVFLHFGKQLGWDTKKLQRISIVAGTAADGFMKMQQGIAPLMETVGMGGIAAPVAGIAAWFMMPQDQRDKLIVQFKAIWKDVSAEFMRQWPAISKEIEKAWDGFSGWFTKTAWPVIAKAADDAFTYLFKEGGPIDKGIVMLKGWLGKMWDSAGTGGKLAMVGVIGVLINKIPGVGAVINSVVGGALNLAFSGIKTIAAASPGILGLGAVITGVGVVAINAWFDHLNAELDKNIAQQEKRIDDMYKRVRGLQEGTKETRKDLREKFGDAGIGGTKKDILGMDPTMKKAIMARKDFAVMEEDAAKRLEAIGTPAALSKAAKMRDMAAGFRRVQGTAQFQLQAQSVGKTVDAAAASGKLGTVGTEGGQITATMLEARKGMLYMSKMEELQKAWAVKGQSDIDQMMIQTSNLQLRLAEAYGQSMTAPQELIAKAAASGMEIIKQVGDGVVANKSYLEDAMFDTLTPIVEGLPHSPVAAGPLKDPFLSMAGQGVLNQILDGIFVAQAAFETGFATVLEQSAVFAIDAFQKKALEEFKNSPINQEIFGKITAQYAGILTEDDKKVLKSSLDMSGLYGVINAVVLDGVETRKVLTEIKDNTAGLRGWTPGAGSGWAQIPQGNGAAAPPPK